MSLITRQAGTKERERYLMGRLVGRNLPKFVDGRTILQGIAWPCLSLIIFFPAIASTQTSLQIEVVVRTPNPERFEVAVDELELQWRGERGAARDQIRTPRPIPRAPVARNLPGRAVLAPRGVTTLQDLTTLVREVEAQNPDGTAQLVLYQAGRPRSEATRRLLGREVAVLLVEGPEGDAALSRLTSMQPRPVASVPRAYIVEAADPLGALDLAERLRTEPGVKTAYSLLQQRAFPR